MPLPPDTFATRLRAVLAHQGVSAAALARRSGLTEGAVSRLLAGTRSPTLESAARVARALGISLDSLAP